VCQSNLSQRRGSPHHNAPNVRQNTKGSAGFRIARDSGAIARGGYHQGRFYALRVLRLHGASRRVQFVALGPKVFPVWFFDSILGELAGRTLGSDDNALAVTASHVRAEFQEEAIGRARRG